MFLAPESELSVIGEHNPDVVHRKVFHVPVSEKDMSGFLLLRAEFNFNRGVRLILPPFYNVSKQAGIEEPVLPEVALDVAVRNRALGVLSDYSISF